MNVYKKKILRDGDTKRLTTSGGETLRVFSQDEFSEESIESIIRNPLSFNVFRFFILNEDETVDYEIPQEDIIVEKTNYSETYQQGVRRTMTLALINIDGKYTPRPSGIWFNTKIRFDVGIKYKNAEKWWTKGVFSVVSPTVSHTVNDNTVEYQLSDKFSRLLGKVGGLETIYEVPMDSDIKSVIADILSIKYAGDTPIDSRPFIYDQVFEGRTTPHTLSVDAGSTLGDLILDLAYMLNAECYYNEHGMLCIESMAESTADYKKPILWHFYENKHDELEHSGETIRYDFENAVNEIYVVGDNINGDIFTAMSQNVDMRSPLSIDLIGRRRKLVTDSNVSSEIQAQDRAQYELRMESILAAEISIQSYLIPFLHVNSIIEADDSFLSWNREQLLVKSINFNVGENSIMSLNCANVSNLPIN